mgnify:CR=1 FL=1
MQYVVQQSEHDSQCFPLPKTFAADLQYFDDTENCYWTCKRKSTVKAAAVAAVQFRQLTTGAGCEEADGRLIEQVMSLFLMGRGCC